MVNVYKPKDLKEALEAMDYSDYTVFAGGTDLMVKKKQWSGLLPAFEKPVIFIADLKELKEISIDDDTLNIGASCTYSDLIDSNLVPETYKQIFTQIASPAIRNIATIGGNICNSSPAGDSLPLLYSLDAMLVIESSCRKFELPIEDFITGPGRNSLTSGELLTAIKLPIKSFDKFIYKKVGTRKSTALSKLSFAAMANVESSMISDIRIAFGAVAPTIIRSRDIEAEIMAMSSKGFLNIDDIAEDYRTLIKPIDDQRSTALYRKAVCMGLLKDFLLNKLS